MNEGAFKLREGLSSYRKGFHDADADSALPLFLFRADLPSVIWELQKKQLFQALMHTNAIITV